MELDLVLSTDIFSETIPKSDDVDQALEVMTGALSLSAEPPAVGFGYLRPLEKKRASEAGEVREVLGTPDIPMGVRLLLKHWGSGSPESYFYQDPYNSSGAKGSNSRIKSPTALVVQDFIARRPPQVMASKQSNVSILPDPFARSQEVLLRLEPNFPVSQDFVSTQVFPGPHGGRAPMKKKAVKKRLGGF